MKYRNWHELNLITKDDCKRSFGQQSCIVLLQQMKDQELFFEVSLHGKRIYEFQSSDPFGKMPLLDSVQHYDLFSIVVKFRGMYVANDVANKIQ